MPQDQAAPSAGGSWRQGLTLAERLDALGRTAHHKPALPGTGRVHWRHERGADIRHVRRLGGPIAVEPHWWQSFWHAYRTTGASGQGPASASSLLAALEPILARVRARLLSQLGRNSSSLLPSGKSDRERLVANIERTLRERLAVAVTKTLVLELAVAARAGLLKGGTSEARFAFFCECLKDPGFAAPLLARHPVLVRRSMAIATGWERATQDLVARLAASEAELIAVFFSDRHPGPLTDAKASGDTHGRGQAVSVLTFASGAQLVYKPRPMAMERGYYGLIQWLNEHGLEHGLKVVRTLDEGAFGWMQFIPVLPCANRTEVERFFARMGAQFDREL